MEKINVFHGSVFLYCLVDESRGPNLYSFPFARM